MAIFIPDAAACRDEKVFWALLNEGMISLNFQRFINGFKG
ncbi:hypothetical protein RintRC_0570 [Richelia intracellularis]|nr:hypothetical protein RintRC_0570 [Richelia intracellularis]